MPYSTSNPRSHPSTFHHLLDVALSTLYLYVGLLCGALFWGISADVLGRRFSWNLTLLLSGALGVAAGGVQSFNAWCGVIALLGFAVGGNCEYEVGLDLEPGNSMGWS